MSVNSEIGFKNDQILKFNDYEIKIKKFEKDTTLKYKLSCEVILKNLKSWDDEINFKQAVSKLETLFSLLKTPFEIVNEKITFFYYEHSDEWIKNMDLNISMSLMQLYDEIPKEIFELLNHLQKISRENQKVYKKILEMIDIYKIGLKHAGSFKRDSFLYFYLILERLADDLPSNPISKKINDPILLELTKFSLNGSQKNKMYMLYIFMEREFLIEDVMGLAEIRNNLAHGKQDIDNDKLQFCKEYSFKILKKYILLNTDK